MTEFQVWLAPKGGGDPVHVESFDNHADAVYAAAEYAEAYGPYGDRFEVRYYSCSTVGA